MEGKLGKVTNRACQNRGGLLSLKDMSETYEDPNEAAPSPDPLLRPVWEEAPSATGGGAGAFDWAGAAGRHRPVAWLGGEALAALLVPLCAAQEALARLDARVAVAPAAVREGLCLRLAFAEAAGWLAHTHSWVHPLDLALRDLGLTGSYGIATYVGRPMRDLPNTYVRHGTRAWEEQGTTAMMAGDQLVTTALVLARQLARLAGTHEDPFASLAEASVALNRFGPAVLDGTQFARWRAEIARSAGMTHDNSAASGGEGDDAQRLPPLLVAARVAEGWMSAGIVDLPSPWQALLAATGSLVSSGGLRAVIPPLWTSYPTLGQGSAAALPGLRSDVAARVAPAGSVPGWLLAFLQLLTEGALAMLRELDRLLEVAERGRALTIGCDRRSRLPEVIDAVLRVPVLTPKSLAAQLAIAPQTATALLRELRAAQLATEITGRRSFRAFAALV
jgi:hypothetical protein